MILEFNDTIFTGFPLLETERLILRAFEKTDAQALYQLRSDARVMEFMDSVYLNSETEAAEKIESIQLDFLHHNGINWVLVDKKTSRVIGYICFWRFIKEHLRAEIGYALTPEFWGCGLMFEAACAVLKFGFETIGLHSVEANINSENQKSLVLLKRLGFVKEAHFRENYLFNGVFLDSIIYSLLESGFKPQRSAG